MNQSVNRNYYHCCRYILPEALLRIFTDVLTLSLFVLFFLQPAVVSAQSGIRFTLPVFPSASQTIPVPNDNDYPALRFEKSPTVPSVTLHDAEPLSPPQRLTSGTSAPEPFRPTPLQSAPLPLPVQYDSEELNEVLQTGRKLEEESRWSDALTHYETALRIYRNENDLMDKFRTARFHYDVSRRFHDTSYLKTLRSVSFVEALRQYDEIIFRLQSNYVDVLDWDNFFRHGIQDIEIALFDADFQKQNELMLSRDKIEKFTDGMNQTAAGWQIQNKDDLRNAVLHLAESSMKQLNLNPVILLMEFTCGVVNSLDPYTSYLTPGQLADTYAMISGKFVGLGVELKSDSESLYVVRVIQNSPAQQAGLRSGDRIHFVNGIATKGKDTDTAADLLQGGEGTTVLLTVQHQGEAVSKEYSVLRRKIDVPSVENVRFLDKELGYVKLTGFQSNTCTELRNAVAFLEQQGLSCLVLDLRHNPGGLLQMGVEVADMFIEDGVIVRTRGRQSSMDTPYMATKKNTLKVPLIILIDGDSASASEIVAGAVRDHNRGVIIGSRSYGKGTIQAIVPIDSKRTTASSAGLRMTVEKFYSPLGKAYSGTGVEPNISVDAGNRITLAKPLNGKIPLPIPALSGSGSKKDPVIQKAVETAQSFIRSNAL